MNGHDIRCIVLDFDGTILDYGDPPVFFDAAVVEILNDLPGRDILWCANSGRDFEDQQRVLARSVEMGLRHLPDALICSESMIFLRDDDDSFVPLEPWNSSVTDALLSFHRDVQKELEPFLGLIRETYRPDPIVWHELGTAFLIDDGDRKPRKLFHDLLNYLAPLPDAMVTMNGGWVAVHMHQLGKGNALAEYARARGFTADQLLAVGDHLNDLNMLNGRPARHVGCPGDAVPEVRQAVRKAGGIVGSLPGPTGTVDVLRSYLDAVGDSRQPA